jgi:hypothetical protein
MAEARNVYGMTMVKQLEECPLVKTKWCVIEKWASGR